VSATKLYNKPRLNICVDRVTYVSGQDGKEIKNNKDTMAIQKTYFYAMVREKMAMQTIFGCQYQDVEPLFIHNTKNVRGGYMFFSGK
jgi:hypothetical protein